jgi:hypothetical protein
MKCDAPMRLTLTSVQRNILYLENKGRRGMAWLNINSPVHWPFSGPVTQDIHPSLLSKAGSDEVELRVLREVASYGRQIGVLSDLLLALVESVQPKTLSDGGKHALAQLRKMAEDIKWIKERQRALPDSPEAARKLIRALEHRFPELKSP